MWTQGIQRRSITKKGDAKKDSIPQIAFGNGQCNAAIKPNGFENKWRQLKNTIARTAGSRFC